jgi:hypothetical protein
MLPVPERPLPRWIVLPALIMAVLGVAAVWAGVTMVSGSRAPWFAMIVALDAVLILHLAGWRRIGGHAMLALAVTAATIVVAQGFIASAQIGSALGLRLADALPRMSAELAVLHVCSNAHASELAWYLAALLLAAWLSRAPSKP